MANSDKNILITPSVGLSTNPTIRFNGANNTPTTLRVLDDGTISFEGTAGQLFSISDGLTGSIFSVNDISGIPSIEVLDTGLVKVNQYSGSTVFGASAAIQNSSSVNAKVSISTVSASTPGLIIKAVSSQTANLQEWQNNAGTVIASVNSGGYINSSGGIKASSHGYIYTSSTQGSVSFQIADGNAGYVPLVIKGVTSQTADLQQWQNSSGTIISRIYSDGSAGLYGLYVFTGGASITGNYGNTDTLQVTINGAARRGILVKGAASQTANLQEWQDSAGTVYAFINPYGQLSIGQSPTIYSNARISLNTVATTVVGMVIRGVASQTADLQQWQNSAGTVLAKVQSNGVIDTSQYLNMSTSGNAGIAVGGSYRIRMTDGNTRIQSSSGIITTLTVEAVASQTANLQEWQNSAGAVVASIDSLGKITSYNRDTVGGNNNLTISGYYNGSTSSLDLQSNGITRASLISSGTIGTDASFRIHTRINDVLSERFRIATSGRFGFNTNSPSSGLHFLNTTASDIGLIVQGAASQTADLQQWQNSSGTALTYIDATGRFLSTRPFRTDDVITAGSQASTLGQISAIASSSTRIGLVVQGASSQTANLQEWQNSSGSVLLSVSSDGSLNKTGTLNIGPILSFADPGVGNETKFVFNKTNDSAYLTVKERSSDQTFYEFGMWDNALDGGDYFQWSMGQWSGGTGQGWMPIQLGYNTSPNGSKTQTLRFTGEQSVFWSPILTGTNTPYYTTTVNHSSNVDYEIFKYYPDTSATRTIPRTNASGGATLNIDLSGYTYSSRMGYRITVNSGGTTFDYSTYGGDNSSGTAIAITVGSWQTLSNGTKIKINGTPAASDDWQFLAFPTPRVSFGGSAEATTLVTIKPSASDKGLVIRGSASQSGNLTNWYAGDGTLGTRIGPYAELVGHNQLANGIGGTIGGTMWAVISGNPGYIPVITQGAASQTVDLQQWRNSAGTVLTKIAADGQLSVGSGTSNYLSTYDAYGNITSRTAGTNYSANISVLTGATSYIGMVIRGQSGQTANLQEWQLSNNFSVLRVLSGGSMLFGNTNVDSNNYLSFIKAGGAAGGYAGIRFGNDVDGSNQQTLTVNTGNAHLVLEHKNASGAFIIKGAASQTADLQQWYNSNGTLMAAVKADGGFRAGGTNGATKFIVDQFGTLSLGADRGGNPTYLFVQSQLTTDVGAVIKGASGQSANLQEWQDSSGTVLTKIRSNGQLNVIGAFSATSFGVLNYDPAWVAAKIQGAASQTANLQEWQNNSGTVLAKVDKDGNFTANNITDTDWISVSSFSNGYSGYGSIAYRKLNGVVYLRGAVSGGTADTTAFNLPAGYRPSADHVVPVQKYGTTDLNHVTIYTNGDVKPNSTAAWLSSVNYPA